MNKYTETGPDYNWTIFRASDLHNHHLSLACVQYCNLLSKKEQRQVLGACWDFITQEYYDYNLIKLHK